MAIQKLLKNLKIKISLNFKINVDLKMIKIVNKF
jgi:hypothetical protein